MRNRNYKVLIDIDGTKYVFSTLAFKIELKRYLGVCKESEKAITSMQLQERFAEELSISTDAIKNWLYGYNGPADIEMVKKLAQCMNIEYKDLLVQQEEEKDMLKLEKGDSNINAVYSETRVIIKDIYASLVQIVKIFQEEMGFYFSSVEIYETVNKMCEVIFDKLHYNMLDIPEKTYNELLDYVGDIQQFWLYGIPCDIWEVSTYTDFVGDRDPEDKAVMQSYVNTLVDDFYAGMRRILQDYIVK